MSAWSVLFQQQFSIIKLDTEHLNNCLKFNILAESVRSDDIISKKPQNYFLIGS